MRMMPFNVFILILILGCLLASPFTIAQPSGFRICFEESERSSQCQGPHHTCSGWTSSPQWTQAFRDDTDNRGGGCKYRWRIEASVKSLNNYEFRLCFREIEGSSQCQGSRSSCTAWGNMHSWTRPFRDDTDNRGGGCKYQWKIESRPSHRNYCACRVCFRETEGSSQCQGNRHSCSGWSSSNNLSPSWTRTFRDDTDNRSGGCNYSWKLQCL